MPNNSRDNMNADILSKLQNYVNKSSDNQDTNIALLRSIDDTVKKILQSGGRMSQSNAQNLMPGFGGSNTYFQSRANYSSKSISGRNSFKQFTNSLESALIEELIGREFKDKLHDVRDKLARDIGVNVSDIPKALGSVIGKNLAKLFSNSAIGRQPILNVNKWLNSEYDKLRQRYVDGRDKHLRDNPINPISLSASWFSNNIRNSEHTRDTSRNDIQNSKLAQSISMQSAIIYAQSVIIQDMSQLSTEERTAMIGQIFGKKQEKASGDNSNDDNFLDVANEHVRKFLTEHLGEEGSSLFSDSMLSELSKLLGDGAKASDISGILQKFAQGSNELGAILTPNLEGLASSMASTMSAGAGASSVLAGLASVGIPLIAGIGLATTAVSLVVAKLKHDFAPAIEGTKKMFDSLKSASNRYENSREKNLKLAQERIEADLKTVITEPFQILKNAAEDLYNTWDSNIRKINATQGYNKDDLQDLIGNFAERLRDERLTKVVSASDITNNLSKVLDSGLSGTVAEEFAYLATKLNAAIPTEDFFNYASIYSSIAASAIQQGKSQSEAIEYANSQLESFASNLLYASREVSGGFTTGLKDANTLFQQSVQIAQASKVNNATEISGVMTAVSAIVGAVAPDLATSMTDAIYKAAVGGNSSEIVALRSLAGINASNTEFLKQISQDPQRIFTTLFTNLGKMQTMSKDAYMEVAEGLSSVFGVSMDAFARVDFNYLAQAISSMNTSNSALSDNFKLLVSGETTTNAEQLKMQQINEYMLEEGLAYVLDNEAARSIQEHMWDEQIARELMESTYGVEIQGSALEFLEGIRKTIDNILGFLNPFKALSKVANLVGSIKEVQAQEVDLRQMLELGKVGNGNSSSLYQLITRNSDLNLTSSLVEMMGGVSRYSDVSNLRKNIVNVLTPWNFAFDSILSGKKINELYALAATGARRNGGGVNSSYNWGTIGKSTSSSLFTMVNGVPAAHGISELVDINSDISATAKAQEVANGNISSMLQSMEEFISKATNANELANYDEWVKTASNYNISDFSAALKSAGLTEDAVKSQFDAYTTTAAAKAEQDRKLREEKFWTDTVTLLTTNNEQLIKIFDNQVKFFEEMVNYFVEHKIYSDSYKHNSVAEIQRKEAKGAEDAVYKLADALTQNSVDLLDPTVQTNALLSQILKVVNAIMQQNNLSGGTTSLPNVLSELAIGSVVKSI